MARAMGEMEPARPDYKPLRLKTAGVDHKTATPGDIRLEKWSDGMIRDQERELFQKIAAEKKTPPVLCASSIIPSCEALCLSIRPLIRAAASGPPLNAVILSDDVIPL